jgi:hypothetical protein
VRREVSIDFQILIYTDQTCCRCTKPGVCPEDSPSKKGEDYDETLIEEIVPVLMKTTRTTMIHI